MSARKLTVVISQSPGKNPVKRELEDQIATQLMLSGSVEVSLVPHLYDLPPDHHGWMFLQSVPGDLVLLGWMYPRALRWVLDRNDVRGLEGISLLKSADEEENESDDLDADKSASGEQAQSKAIGSVRVPKRKIYVLDLRAQSTAEPYLAEIDRISKESAVQLVTIGQWPPPAAARPANDTAATRGSEAENGHAGTNGHAPGNGHPTTNGKPLPGLSPAPVLSLLPDLGFGGLSSPENGATPALTPAAAVTDLKRRWYPVIDYSRCTNCMECLDFCLFGVYGVDSLERILVEEQDNCKRGCPACSRVCPANAIIFPEHKTPAIAGAPTDAAGDFKIDLSKLFGAPSALEIAAQERDQELVQDGRDAVGMSVGIPKRQAQKVDQPKDALDSLMDQLDTLEI